MVIKYAEYRSLKNNNTCGSSYDYSCSLNVTCHLKRQCDGKRECNIIVDDNLFPSTICFGSQKYLYFEYQCKDNMTSFNETCFSKFTSNERFYCFSFLKLAKVFQIKDRFNKIVIIELLNKYQHIIYN